MNKEVVTCQYTSPTTFTKCFKLLSLIIILASLSGCQTMQSIDKGLYDATEAVSDQDRVTGERVLNFQNRQQQIQKAKEYESSIIAEFKSKGLKINEELDSVEYERLSQIVNRVLAASHFKNETWRVYLLPDDSFNAFVIGGDSVFVHHGLFNKVQNDDEIAAVVGHEIAHVAANHLGEHSASMLALKITGSKSIDRDGYSQSFTTLQEGEADKIGVLYAALAGYNPGAGQLLWNRLSEDDPGLTFRYEDHPKSRERAAKTEQYAELVAQYYIPNELNQDAEAILACNTLWCKSVDSVQPGDGGGILSALNVALETYSKHQEAKLEKKRQDYEMALTRAKLNIIAKLSNHAYVSGSIYIGEVKLDSGQGTMQVHTQFVMDNNNVLHGAYRYYATTGPQVGQLTVQQIDNQNGVLHCTYKDQTGTGRASFQFSADGTQFNGVWAEPDKNAKGSWVGKLRL